MTPKNWRMLQCLAKWSLPTKSCQMGKTSFQMSRVRCATNAENSAGSSFAEILPFQSSLWHRHDGNSESVGSRTPNPNITRHLSWDTSPPGSTQAGLDSDRDLFHIATVPNLVPTFNNCANPGILPVVTDLETPWQNSVVERHGALF